MVLISLIETERESTADSSSPESQITAYKSFAPKTLIALVHLKAHTLTHTHTECTLKKTANYFIIYAFCSGKGKEARRVVEVVVVLVRIAHVLSSRAPNEVNRAARENKLREVSCDCDRRQRRRTWCEQQNERRANESTSEANK